MAYMYRIQSTCDHSGCIKPRTYRVCSATNDTKGDYCKRHAEQRLRDLQATENQQTERARASSAPLSPREAMDRHLAEFGK